MCAGHCCGLKLVFPCVSLMGQPTLKSCGSTLNVLQSTMVTGVSETVPSHFRASWLQLSAGFFGIFLLRLCPLFSVFPVSPRQTGSSQNSLSYLTVDLLSLDDPQASLTKEGHCCLPSGPCANPTMQFRTRVTASKESGLSGLLFLSDSQHVKAKQSCWNWPRFPRME